MSNWTTPAVVRVALVHDARAAMETWDAIESLETHPSAPAVRRWLAARVRVGRGRPDDHQRAPVAMWRRTPSDGDIVARELAITVFRVAREELTAAGFFRQGCGHGIDEAYAIVDGETWSEVCDVCERAGLPVFP
jgi:hypothetical protein